MSYVRLVDVDFSYPVFQLVGRSLKVTVIRQVAGGRIAGEKGAVEVAALSRVSFELEPGDRLALVGHNGSGKSTLLRLIAGLAHPKRGVIHTKGRIIPLIEKGMGINPELSGYDNIELPLRLLGATSAEVRHAKETIPEWTGLGNFIRLPYRTYSEGMKARLSFALCTLLPADILVLDEWFGAGDLAFYQQAQERLNSYVHNMQIVVLASHSNELLRTICNKAIWMERGNLVMMGDVDTVIDSYVSAMTAPVAVAAE